MDVRITLAFSNEMRITSSNRDSSNLAKCTKMTEGEHRIHGMNGVSDSGNGSLAVAVKEEKETAGAAPDTYNNLGGRLKFFKNGRFILELARAREGEKVAWVPVPKKTFWPPPGSTSSLSTYRQESSTSLSVSDDNSSIQSSPWQRDHTWKQSSPQRNISSNLNFYFTKPKNVRKTCWQYKLQRSPYLVPTEQQRTNCSIFSNNKCNNSKCVNNNSRSSAIVSRKKTLVHVVEFLWNKTLQTFNSITSPRKRILRELERVTIDDESIYNKRCRGKVPPTKTGANNNKNNDNSLVQNGEEQPRPSGKNCSYSITSLLGGNESNRDRDREREEKSSPSVSYTDPPNNTNTNSSNMKNNKTPSPHYNYHLSHPPQFMPPYPIYSSVLQHHPHHHHPAATVASYISPYYHQGPAAAAAYAAVRPSAFYQPLISPVHQPVGPRHEPYSPPWNSYEQHIQASTLHRDDSDVPLNLSKHAD